MPGLIESKTYSESKARLCAEHERAEDAIEALEWRLIHARSLEVFPAVQSDEPIKEGQHGSGIVRAIVVEASSSTPAVVAVFTTEQFCGVEKVLLLDVWLSDEDEED